MTPTKHLTIKAELCHLEFSSSYNGRATVKMTIVRKKRTGEEIIHVELVVPRDMIAPTVRAMRTFVSREVRDVQSIAGYTGSEA